MKTFILSAILICLTHISFAEEKAPPKAADQNQHIQMHEQMAKAHQQAADCLKSGKPAEECKKAFHEMNKEMGEHENCGHGMKHHKHHKMDKKAK